MIKTAVASERDAGRKIKYFARSDMQLSYSLFKSIKMQGGLVVNGNIVHADYILNAGDRIELIIPEKSTDTAEPIKGNVNIIYEDDDLLIIDKQAPLACQSSSRNPSPALENMLMDKFGPSFVFRPINRLDKGTSGLMCAAKHAHSADLLQRLLHTDCFIRSYLAVVDGFMEGSGVLDYPIAKINESSVRRVVDFENGKPSITYFETLFSSEKRSLVRLTLQTGRTHQIRVHLSHIGHPVTGDFLYGSEIPELDQRFALHSAHITLFHPLSGEKMEFDSPLPDELNKLLW